ncbi:MAG TPA: hypothetical protein V6D19_10895 [Stenomitos sp.]
MPEQVCGRCLDFDSIHQCCQVRIEAGKPCSYLAVTATTSACFDFNDVQSVQLPGFVRLSDRLKRRLM